MVIVNIEHQGGRDLPGIPKPIVTFYWSIKPLKYGVLKVAAFLELKKKAKTETKLGNITIYYYVYYICHI